MFCRSAILGFDPRFRNMFSWFSSRRHKIRGRWIPNPWSCYPSKNEQTSLYFWRLLENSATPYLTPKLSFSSKNLTFQHMSNHTSRSQCAKCSCFLNFFVTVPILIASGLDHAWRDMSHFPIRTNMISDQVNHEKLIFNTSEIQFFWIAPVAFVFLLNKKSWISHELEISHKKKLRKQRFLNFRYLKKHFVFEKMTRCLYGLWDSETVHTLIERSRTAQFQRT